MFESLRSFGTVVRRLVALLPVLIAVTTLPVALLALFNVGVVNALEILVVGWLLLTPVAAIIAWIVLDLSPVALPWSLGDRGIDLSGVADRDRSGADAGADPDDPVDLLRERFARGEIEQAEFERRLDSLLETEDADAGRGGVSATRPASAGDSRVNRQSPARRDREPESS
ncbi:SHOCT domain-containing protein [Halosimplex salinum]|uniref:SHOCT domain-containing protein n=1 Tax=Halosimplex salinum TaxID=1710538 RepID=UPI0019CFA75A|nr:SHOCT domain-containing protein [Halosimplex salinum]